ncbi:MAG TPA: NAD(P)-dependent oxidoreductase [Chthoniobacteraceae bacterium]|jgi:3-hydroxyisobutyrate dehydrogenase-like beta-hydroxyacid dehydrogenase|nr:NAD(P)-dependent oxidoreductase [Chthoniobacteraceae bacterium]
MRRKLRKNVGIIGLGIVGSRAAAGLRAAGFHCFVWNRSPKPVPNFLGSPAEVAASCEVIQLFVADAAAVMEVLTAMESKLTPAHIVICSATIGPESTLEAAKFVEDKGARFLDAPFTGSKLAAERRELVYYVGGDDGTFLPVKPMLEATSKTIVRTGGVGDAALIKVVTNQIAAVSIQVLAEALAIVRKAGVPPEVFAAALEHNAARSGTMDLKLPKMLSGDYEPHFSLKHMFKDVQLAIHLANSMNLDTPTAAVTAGVLFGAIKRGWGDLDFASLYRLYSDDGKNAPSLPEGAPPESPYDDATVPIPGAPVEPTVAESAPPAAGEPVEPPPNEAPKPPADEKPPATPAENHEPPPPPAPAPPEEHRLPQPQESNAGSTSHWP